MPSCLREWISTVRMELQLLEDVCSKLFFDFQPHVIVHCAAERRPDVVESQPDAASQLNVAASGNLAKEAGKETVTRICFLVRLLHLFMLMHT